MAESEDLEVSF